jgi:hypothetical protein
VVLGEVKGDKGRQHGESHDDKRDNDVEVDVKARQIPDFFQVLSHHFGSIGRKLCVNGQKLLVPVQKRPISFQFRNVQFFASSRKSAALRGGVLLYAAQAIPDLSRQRRD